ncbi:MAG: VOC family protein [Anaerolineaceae bacterium]|nr:VOC family protein [Anaerolineaceae bacterium]MDD4043541.1 VOC family protein [Anaerolineaceae bacterium]
MKLEHVALYVQDLERMKEFYVRHFAATPHHKYHNPQTGLQTYFLSFNDGARLELMQRPGMSPKAAGEHPLGYVHIAFKLGTPEKVDQLTAKLQESGCPLINGPRLTGDGYYESVLTDPEGNLIELVA